MFAYISKINHKDIVDYTRDIVCLYYNVDDSDDGNEYLFNTQTITNWAKGDESSEDSDSRDSSEGVPPMFSYN